MFSTLNYFTLYQDLIAMLISLQASKVSGSYNSIEHSGNSGFSAKSNEDKLALLREIEHLQARLSCIRSEIKKETQMNNKVRLNIEATKVKQAITDIKNQLN